MQGNITKDNLSEKDIRKEFVSFLIGDQEEFEFLVEQNDSTELVVFSLFESKLGNIKVCLKPLEEQCKESQEEQPNIQAQEENIVKRSKETFKETLTHKLTMESTHGFEARYQSDYIDSILNSKGELEEVKTEKDLLMILFKFLKNHFQYKNGIRMIGRRYSYSDCCQAESMSNIMITLVLDGENIIEKVEEL